MPTLDEITDQDVTKPEVRTRVRNQLVYLVATYNQQMGDARACPNLDVDQDGHLVHGCDVHWRALLTKAVESLRWVERYAPAERTAYRERATLIGLMLAMPGAQQVIRSAAIAFNDPQLPGWPVLYVQHEWGSVAWHIHPLDVDLVSQVPVVEPMDARALWSGTTKDDELRGLAYLRKAILERAAA
jgi:hypothetical protein